VLWEREAKDPGRAQETFTITSDQQLLATREIELDFERGTRLRTIINLGGLVVPKGGPLLFRIAAADDIQAEYTIDVTAPPAAVPFQRS
jgi:hypothetical protein